MTRFNQIGPHFAVRDLSNAIAFFSKVLGFEVDYLDGDPPRYAVVFCDDVYIHLSLPDSPGFAAGSGRAFVAVSGVDSVWQKAASLSAGSIVQPLEDRDYGQGVRFRVFTIADPDGNALRIGEPLGADA